MRDTEAQRHKQREKHAPCREPDVELDPRTLGLWPKPKRDAQPLSHPGVLWEHMFLSGEQKGCASHAKFLLHCGQIKDLFFL